MAENIYQQRKAGNDLIASVRRIFQEPQYQKFFKVVTVSRIQEASGKDTTVKVELHVPGNPKAQDVKHISVLGYKPENKHLWDTLLRREAETTKKKMRMVRSRAAEVVEI